MMNNAVRLGPFVPIRTTRHFNHSLSLSEQYLYCYFIYVYIYIRQALTMD